jgi:hypothetical protein
MAITKASVVRGLGNRRQEIASVVLGLLAGCLLGFFFMTVVEMVRTAFADQESLANRHSRSGNKGDLGAGYKSRKCRRQ